MERTFWLHNVSIHEYELIPINLNHLDALEFSHNYSEFLDPIGDVGTKNITIREAILLQIKSDGHKWPEHNIMHNQQNTEI